MNTPEPRPPRIIYPRAIIYVPVFLASALAIPSMDSFIFNSGMLGGLLIALLGGFILGGFGVSLIWAVLGPRTWWVRLGESFALIGCQIVCLSMSVVMEDFGSREILEWLASWLMLPLAFLIALIPILIYRAITGCHFRGLPEYVSFPKDVSDETVASSATSQQFDLRDMFLITTLVAVAFGLARFGISVFGSGMGMAQLWLGFGITMLWIHGAVILGILPCLSAARRIDRASMGFTFVVTWSGMLTLGCTTVGTVLEGSSPPGELIFLLYGFFFTLIGMLYYSVKILQAGGYVLAGGREK